MSAFRSFGMAFWGCVCILIAVTVQDVWASSEESKASSSRIAGLLMGQDRKDIELAVKLIKEGEGVHYISPKTGEGALHVACIWGHEDAVEALLYGGADPNLRTRVETGLDMTPLTWCAYGCHRNSIRKFIADDRVDVNMIVRDEDHGLITALDIVMRIGDRCGKQLMCSRMREPRRSVSCKRNTVEIPPACLLDTMPTAPSAVMSCDVHRVICENLKRLIFYSKTTNNNKKASKRF